MPHVDHSLAAPWRRRAHRDLEAIEMWLPEAEEYGFHVAPDGTAIVYHATTPEKAESILKEKVLRNPPGTGGNYGVYVSSSPSVVNDYGDGTTVVKMRVRAADLHLDDTPGRADFPIHTTGGVYRPLEVLGVESWGETESGEWEKLASWVRGWRRTAAAVEITGEELGVGLRGPALRRAAVDYALTHFLGKTVTVRRDGASVEIPSKGIRKSLSSSRSEEELRSIVALPQLLEAGIRIQTDPDKENNPGIKAVHCYQSTISIAGRFHVYLMVVKETRQGNKFYDGYTEKRPRSSGLPEGSSASRPSPDSGQPDLGPSTGTEIIGRWARPVKIPGVQKTTITVQDGL